MDASKQSAVFKSKADKTMDIVIGKDNPGIGQYNAYHQNTLANKEFQGGAANNFVLFTRQNYQVRNPEIKPVPRIGEMIVNSTPANVGPGKYLDQDKKDFVSMFKPKQGVSNLQFGLDQRFKHQKPDDITPGPGSYNEQNKWN